MAVRFFLLLILPLILLLTVACEENSDLQSGDEVSAVATATLDLNVGVATTPTPDDASSLVDDCLQFTRSVAVALTNAGEAVGAISDLALSAAENPAVLLGGSWQEAVRSEYQSVRVSRELVANLDAPIAAFNSIQTGLLIGFDQLLASEAPLLEGADTFDAEKVNQAAGLLTASTATFNDVDGILDEVEPSECTG